MARWRRGRIIVLAICLIASLGLSALAVVWSEPRAATAEDTAKAPILETEIVHWCEAANIAKNCDAMWGPPASFVPFEDGSAYWSAGRTGDATQPRCVRLAIAAGIGGWYSSLDASGKLTGRQPLRGPNQPILVCEAVFRRW